MNSSVKVNTIIIIYSDLDDWYAKRKDIYEALYPETKHNASFKGNQFSSKSESDSDQKDPFTNANKKSPPGNHPRGPLIIVDNNIYNIRISPRTK